MNLIDTINYITSLEAQRAILSEQLQSTTERSIDVTKFDKVILTTMEVAKLHNVSTKRVCDYAKRGLIDTHPDSTDDKFLFRATTILKLDFDALKKEKAILKR